MADKNKVDLIAFSKENKKIIIKDRNISLNSEFGSLDRKDLLNIKKCGKITTSKNETLVVMEPTFREKYRNLKKGAQSIKIKDCSIILGETLVGKDSVCLDCGAGMGGLTCFLARYVKKVFSCDYVEKHLENSKENSERLGLKNIKFIQCDIYEGIPTKQKLDLITLDLINPEKVLKFAKKSLKTGGFIVAYCPQATQMQAFVNEAKKQNFEYLKSIEINTREWEIGELILRPKHIGLQHTAFISFARKIWD